MKTLNAFGCPTHFSCKTKIKENSETDDSLTSATEEGGNLTLFDMNDACYGRRGLQKI